ncbi:DUF1775 domain-containing protein [Microbacterium sp. NPDC057407]|uniref:DUF1775 domain-containing protein n=1 Tax=Microbacterium sp. NPDC057407 TaxID=3346120 RepID=UPI00366D8CC6
MTTSLRSARARRTALIGGAAGVTLALAAPLAASAHVHVDPGAVAAGTTSTLTFAFSHGCDGSPTTALVIDIPEGIGNVTPLVQGGWTVSRETGDDGIPTRVTYTAETPVEDHLKATVAMDVLFDESAAGSSIAFPVVQTCVDGEIGWTQVAEAGQSADDLESPAPVVAVGAVGDESGGHGHATEAAPAHSDDDAADSGGEAAGAADAGAGAGGDPVARWLAAGGLAAGIAALAVVLVRGRARKS